MKILNSIATGAWFAFLFILLWMTSAPLTSCSTKKSLTSSLTVKDSTWVKKTVKPFDTVVKIPGNKVGVTASLDELTEGKLIENRSKNLTASLRREGNNIIADCKQDELEMIIQLQKELLEVYRLRETEQKDKETVVETKKEVPWYLVPLVWLGGICLIIIIVALLIKFLKPKKV